MITKHIIFYLLNALICLGILGFSALKGEDYSNSLTKENLFEPDKILPVSEAFRLNYQIDDENIYLIWSINKDCYLYKDKFTFFKDGKQISAPMPEGKTIEDEFFGRVKVFYDKVETQINKKNSEILLISYQGCHKKGYCYTPVKESIKLSSLKFN